MKPGEREGSSLGNSLEDITKKASDLWVFKAKDLTAGLAAGGLIGAAFMGAAAVAVARDRRRAVLRLGIAIVVVGLLLGALVPLVQWFVGRSVGDAQLASAVRGALGRAMADLQTIGLWIAAYGVVAAAAAASMGERHQRLTPRRAADAIGRWVQRRRQTTWGTVVLGVLAIFVATLVTQESAFWSRAAVFIAGLWLAYFGVTELLGLVRKAIPVAVAEGRSRSRRIVLVAGAVVAMAGLVTGGLLLTAGRAARRADAAGKPQCNGDSSLCDLPLNFVLFPATHNSMSSALYPGWLFAEHALTIEGQLQKGVRALLIDTHYGVPSASRLPGSETQLVLTDRASELHDPKEERADPVAAQRADQLAARAPKGAAANRGIYLCHARCELGATKFGDALAGIKSFVVSHPDEVVLLDIEDHTDPVETAKAIEASGLSNRAYILGKDKPLPTLGDMILAGKNVLIAAEIGGSGTPPWYHRAYDWLFQETPYSFDKPEDFNCAPNRGPANAPLFLVNHWLSNHDPAIYSKVNSRQELSNRLRRCITERGRMPNVIAVDFSEKGDLIGTVKDTNAELLDEYRKVRGIKRPPPTGPTTTTTAPKEGTPPPGPALPPLNQGTSIPKLTGGDPALFCQAIPAANKALNVWALASFVATPASRGLPDLAFGPVVARDAGRAYAVGPVELARQGALAMDRARAAVDALRALGLDQAAIDRQADLGASEVASAENRDPVLIQGALLDELSRSFGTDRVNAAAAAFSQSHPEPPGLFDLGDVSDDVVRNSGYACALPGS